MSKLKYKGTATVFKRGQVYDVELMEISPLEGPTKEKVLIVNIDGRNYPYKTLSDFMKNWEVAPTDM